MSNIKKDPIKEFIEQNCDSIYEEEEVFFLSQSQLSELGASPLLVNRILAEGRRRRVSKFLNSLKFIINVISPLSDLNRARIYSVLANAILAGSFLLLIFTFQFYLWSFVVNRPAYPPSEKMNEYMSSMTTDHASKLRGSHFLSDYLMGRKPSSEWLQEYNTADGVLRNLYDVQIASIKTGVPEYAISEFCKQYNIGANDVLNSSINDKLIDYTISKYPYFRYLRDPNRYENNFRTILDLSAVPKENRFILLVTLVMHALTTLCFGFWQSMRKNITSKFVIFSLIFLFNVFLVLLLPNLTSKFW